MAKKSAADNTDALLKALFCLCRAVDEVLDAQAIESAGGDHRLSPSWESAPAACARASESRVHAIAARIRRSVIFMLLVPRCSAPAGPGRATRTIAPVGARVARRAAC